MTMHFAMNNQDFKAWSEFFFFEKILPLKYLYMGV